MAKPMGETIVAQTVATLRLVRGRVRERLGLDQPKPKRRTEEERLVEEIRRAQNG